MNHKARILWVLTLTLLLPALGFCQGVVKVFGTVKNHLGQPLPGAVIWINGLPNRAQADGQGRFVLPVNVPRPIPGAGVYGGMQGYKPAGFIVPLDPRNPPRVPVNIVLQPAPAAARPPQRPQQPQQPQRPVQPVQPTQTAQPTGEQPSFTAPITPTKNTNEKAPVHIQVYSAGPKDGLPDVMGYSTPSTAPKGFEKKNVRFIKGVPYIIDDPKAKKAKPKPRKQPKPKKKVVPQGPPVEFVIQGSVKNPKGRPVGGADVFFAKRRDGYAKTDRRGNFELKIIVPKSRVRMGRTIVIQHKNFMVRQIPIEFNPAEEAGVRLPSIRLRRYRGLVR